MDVEAPRQAGIFPAPRISPPPPPDSLLPSGLQRTSTTSLQHPCQHPLIPPGVPFKRYNPIAAIAAPSPILVNILADFNISPYRIPPPALPGAKTFHPGSCGGAELRMLSKAWASQ